MNRCNLAFISLWIGITPWVAVRAGEPVGVLRSLDQGPSVIALRGANSRQAKPGDPLFAGDHIVTAADQTVLAELRDGSELTIAPDSDFTVDRLQLSGTNRTAEVALDHGMANAKVAKGYSPSQPFFFKTASSVMGVRGTEFVVEHDGAQGSSLHTFEGSVAVGHSVAELNDPGKAILVGPGMTTSVHAGQIARPTRFNPAQFQQHLTRRGGKMINRVQHHFPKGQSTPGDDASAASKKPRKRRRHP